MICDRQKVRIGVRMRFWLQLFYIKFQLQTKMKRTIAILVALLCLMANANFSFAMREGGPGDTIILKGEIIAPGRSQSEPITASVDDANLYVGFHADLGCMTITIYSASGAVAHTETVYAQANDGLQISLEGFASGSYLVVFSNAQGSLMGKFSI